MLAEELPLKFNVARLLRTAFGEDGIVSCSGNQVTVIISRTDFEQGLVTAYGRSTVSSKNLSPKETKMFLSSCAMRQAGMKMSSRYGARSDTVSSIAARNENR
jgi:hypothetical protein